MQNLSGSESLTLMLFVAVVSQATPLPDGLTREQWLIEKFAECRRAVEGMPKPEAK